MPELPKRQLGRTGLQVTTLGYGAMELRGAPRGRDVTEEQANSMLNAVLDSGINYIDTSIDYGISEERIGRAISSRRSEFYLASKCGCPVNDDSNSGAREHIFTKENIVAGVEQSLRRMNTDYLDVVQFHSSPSIEKLREHDAIGVLQDLQRQGKIRHLGMSGTLPNIRDQITLGVFDVFQIPYSALEREHEEIIVAAAESGAGVVVRGGVAKGDGAPGRGWDMWQQAGLDDLLGEMTRMEFILRFTLSHPDMDTTIVGTVNPAHLQANVNAALKGPLPSDVYEETKRRLDEAGAIPIAAV